MGQIISDKPLSGFVKSNSPISGSIKVDKPVSNFIDSETLGNVYMEDKTIRVGEPMGMLLCLTYPATVSFQGERI